MLRLGQHGRESMPQALGEVLEAAVVGRLEHDAVFQDQHAPPFVSRSILPAVLLGDLDGRTLHAQGHLADLAGPLDGEVGAPELLLNLGDVVVHLPNGAEPDLGQDQRQRLLRQGDVAAVPLHLGCSFTPHLTQRTTLRAIQAFRAEWSGSSWGPLGWRSPAGQTGERDGHLRVSTEWSVGLSIGAPNLREAAESGSGRHCPRVAWGGYASCCQSFLPCQGGRRRTGASPAVRRRRPRLRPDSSIVEGQLGRGEVETPKLCR